MSKPSTPVRRSKVGPGRPGSAGEPPLQAGYPCHSHMQHVVRSGNHYLEKGTGRPKQHVLAGGEIPLTASMEVLPPDPW